MKVIANLNLIKSRAELGLTIRELSNIANVPISTISRAENGLPLSIKSASRLSEALSKPLDSIFEFEGGSKNDSTNIYTK